MERIRRSDGGKQCQREGTQVWNRRAVRAQRGGRATADAAAHRQRGQELCGRPQQMEKRGWLRGDAPLAARARGGWWSSARDGLPGGAHCTALNSRAPGLRIVDTCVARISNAWNFSLPSYSHAKGLPRDSGRVTRRVVIRGDVPTVPTGMRPCSLEEEEEITRRYYRSRSMS